MRLDAGALALSDSFDGMSLEGVLRTAKQRKPPAFLLKHSERQQEAAAAGAAAGGSSGARKGAKAGAHGGSV